MYSPGNPTIEQLRRLFPTCDVSRALHQIATTLETIADPPQPGTTIVQPNYEGARQSRLNDQPLSLDETLRQLMGYATKSHADRTANLPSQQNMVPSPSLASIVASCLATLGGANLVSDDGGQLACEAESRVVAMVAELVDFDPARAGGIFTFGGTGAMLYGLRIGLEKAFPDSMHHGVHGTTTIFASAAAHHACESVAAWSGCGMRAVQRVEVDGHDAVDLAALAAAMEEAIARDIRVACIVATIGTTDLGAADNLAGIAELRDHLVRKHQLPYVPHIHADAVSGWAWSVFGNYDWNLNLQNFNAATITTLERLRCMTGDLHRADSIGIDFHKTGFAPYISSLVLVRDAGDFELLRLNQQPPYLFQAGEYHPGQFTLETSRSAAGPLAALASLLSLGRSGMRVLLAHHLEMATTLRTMLSARTDIAVLNPQGPAATTLFRVYPPGMDAMTMLKREQSDLSAAALVQQHNALNRDIHELLQAGAQPAISITERRAADKELPPLLVLKSCINSPHTEPSHCEQLLRNVLAARQQILHESTQRSCILQRCDRAI